MADDDEGAPSSSDSVLATWVRCLLLAAGLAANSAGSVAVFVSDNQAGTVAILVLGGALLFFAVLGAVPARGSIGNVSWAFAGRALDNLLKDENPEVRAAAAEEVSKAAQELVDSPQKLVQAARLVNHSNVIQYEWSVLNAIRSVTDGTILVEGASGHGGDRGVDVIIGDPADKMTAIAVEVKLRPSFAALRAAVDRLEQLGFTKVVVVAPSFPASTISLIDELSKARGINVALASWETVDDNDHLRAVMMDTMRA